LFSNCVVKAIALLLTSTTFSGAPRTDCPDTPSTPADAERSGREIRRVFTELGLSLHPTKTDLPGKQALELLGIVVDTRRQLYLLSPEKTTQNRLRCLTVPTILCSTQMTMFPPRLVTVLRTGQFRQSRGHRRPPLPAGSFQLFKRRHVQPPSNTVPPKLARFDLVVQPAYKHSRRKRSMDLISLYLQLLSSTHQWKAGVQSCTLMENAKSPYS
jgi:hypothetical protein